MKVHAYALAVLAVTVDAKKHGHAKKQHKKAAAKHADAADESSSHQLRRVQHEQQEQKQDFDERELWGSEPCPAQCPSPCYGSALHEPDCRFGDPADYYANRMFFLQCGADYSCHRMPCGAGTWWDDCVDTCNHIHVVKYKIASGKIDGNTGQCTGSSTGPTHPPISTDPPHTGTIPPTDPHCDHCPSPCDNAKQNDQYFYPHCHNPYKFIQCYATDECAGVNYCPGHTVWTECSPYDPVNGEFGFPAWYGCAPHDYTCPHGWAKTAPNVVVP